MLHDDLSFISREHYDSLPRNHCQPGDVIIGLGDPNLKACIVPDGLRDSLNKADCLLMRVDHAQAERQYVCFLLNCRATVEKACELVRGEIRGRISIGRLKELQIPLPPLDLQCQFAAIVESVEKQKTTPADPSSRTGRYLRLAPTTLLPRCTLTRHILGNPTQCIFLPDGLESGSRSFPLLGLLIIRWNLPY